MEVATAVDNAGHCGIINSVHSDGPIRYSATTEGQAEQYGKRASQK
jgi:hypothetical protein